MGAWGSGIFEDDTTLDNLDDILFNDTWDKIRFNLVSNQQFDYLEYDDACAVIISAVLIEAIKNNKRYDVGENQLNDWLEQNKSVDISDLIEPALNSLEGVLSEESELNELWQENESLYPIWRGNIEAIIEGLSQ